MTRKSIDLQEYFGLNTTSILFGDYLDGLQQQDSLKPPGQTMVLNFVRQQLIQRCCSINENLDFDSLLMESLSIDEKNIGKEFFHIQCKSLETLAIISEQISHNFGVSHEGETDVLASIGPLVETVSWGSQSILVRVHYQRFPTLLAAVQYEATGVLSDLLQSDPEQTPNEPELSNAAEEDDVDFNDEESNLEDVDSPSSLVLGR